MEVTDPQQRFRPRTIRRLAAMLRADFTRRTTLTGTTSYHPAGCTDVRSTLRESNSTFDSHTLWCAIGCWRGSHKHKSNAYASSHEDWYAWALL